MKLNSSRDKGRWVTFAFSLWFSNIIETTDVPTDEAAAHPDQSVLSSSHYQDNTSAASLVGMCRSSVGSLGTTREQFVPTSCQPSPPPPSPALFQQMSWEWRLWESDGGLRRSEIKTQRSLQALLPGWHPGASLQLNPSTDALLSN